MLRDLCSLYALTAIERDKAWFMEHNRISDDRAKSVTREINQLLVKIRPNVLAVVEGLGVPVETLGAAMLD